MSPQTNQWLEPPLFGEWLEVAPGGRHDDRDGRAQDSDKAPDSDDERGRADSVHVPVIGEQQLPL